MKRPSSYWTLFLVLTFLMVLSACTRPAPSSNAVTPEMTPDLLQPTVDPALVTPITPPIVQPTPDGSVPVEQPTLDPNAPVATVDPNAPTIDPATIPTVVATSVPPVANPSVYTVQSGDTMGRIAEQFGVSLQDLVAANPQITTPDSIQVGDVVNIPGAGGVTTTPPQTGERVHSVQAGDNLYRIGLLYGCTVAQLVQHNSLTNPDNLEIGQQIRIPVCE